MSTATSIIIFGATGDLTHRKLLPALYNNFRKGRLDSAARVLGYARRDWTPDYFRERARDGILQYNPKSFDEDTFVEFAKLLSYVRGNLDSAEDFSRLQELLTEREQSGSARLYYLATAPKYYAQVSRYLGETGMADESHGSRRVVIEKPFGHDGASASELDETIHTAFHESQVFRIDHYLGKETAQNVLFLRFANTIFEPVWNRRYISSVQITVAEAVDVGTRAGYYDESGVLRDMFQNHLLQLLALTAMEPPASLQADDVRNEKAKVLRAVAPVDLSNTVRAQYNGYREADGVAAESTTPTFAAMALYVNTWRWQGVPFYLFSGKALRAKTSEIIVRFQEPPGFLFNLQNCDGYTPNAVSICLQPNEGIHVKYQVKVPDRGNASRTVNMSFDYETAFPDSPIPDAYERLLLDAVHGDASLFARSDEIEASWQIIDPVIAAWERAGETGGSFRASSPAVSGSGQLAMQSVPPLCFYEPGSWGPYQADDLLLRNGDKRQFGCVGPGREDEYCRDCNDSDD